jgi:hypothetical protein
LPRGSFQRWAIAEAKTFIQPSCEPEFFLLACLQTISLTTPACSHINHVAKHGLCDGLSPMGSRGAHGLDLAMAWSKFLQGPTGQHPRSRPGRPEGDLRPTEPLGVQGVIATRRGNAVQDDRTETMEVKEPEMVEQQRVCIPLEPVPSGQSFPPPRG